MKNELHNSCILFVCIFSSFLQEDTSDFVVYKPRKGWAHYGVSKSAHELKALPLFRSIYENVRCDDPKLTKGLSKGLADCKARCNPHEECNFFAYWTKRKWCETYEKCTSTSADKGNDITVYKRSTECDVVMDEYLSNIAAQFPEGIIRTHGHNRNIHCKCLTRTWMFCTIFVEKDSEEEGVIARRLFREDLEPFQVLVTVDNQTPGPLVYIRPQPLPIPSIGRHASSTAEIKVAYPVRCIDLDLCNRGTPANEAWGSPAGFCPIEKEPFKSGDPVYILNDDIQTLMQGEPIACISMTGLRIYSAMSTDGGIIDPWYRQEERRVHMKRDYTIFYAFSKDELDEGVCGTKVVTLQAKKPRRKKKGKSAAGPSSEEPRPASEDHGPSSSEMSSLPGDSSPGSSRAPPALTRSESAPELTSLSESAEEHFISPPVSNLTPDTHQKLDVPQELPSPTQLPTHTELPEERNPVDLQTLNIAESQPLDDSQERDQSEERATIFTDEQRMERKIRRIRKGIPASFLPDPDEHVPPIQDSGGWTTVSRQKSKKKSSTNDNTIDDQPLPQRESSGAGPSDAPLLPSSDSNVDIIKQPTEVHNVHKSDLLSEPLPAAVLPSRKEPRTSHPHSPIPALSIPIVDQPSQISSPSVQNVPITTADKSTMTKRLKLKELVASDLIALPGEDSSEDDEEHVAIPSRPNFDIRLVSFFSVFTFFFHIFYIYTRPAQTEDIYVEL